MDPFSLITAAGSIASPVLGLFGQRSQAGYNNAMIALAQRELAQQQQIADRQMEIATAGQTNARGDNVRYVPGVGWIESLSPTSRSLMGASDAETLQRSGDYSRARIGRRMNADRRANEGSVADTELRNYRNPPNRSQAGVEGALIEAGVANANDPIDDMRRAVQMQALRSGTGAAHVIDALASRGRGNVRSAIANARVQAPGLYEEENSQRQSNTGNRYNLFATRASNIDDLPFSPSNVGENLDATAATARAVAPQALGGASAASARGTGGLLTTYNQARNNQPNYGLFAGSLSAGLDNLYQTLAKRDRTGMASGSGGGTWTSKG